MTRDTGGSSSNGSLMANKKPPVFDISNEVGMLALLRTIHRSGTKQKDKNELRDLLFAVQNDDVKAQAEVIKALEIAGFKATFGGKQLASDVSIKNTNEKPKGFGRLRTAPRFAAQRVPVSVAQVKPSEPESQVSVSEPAQAEPKAEEAPKSEEVQPQEIKTQPEVPPTAPEEKPPELAVEPKGEEPQPVAEPIAQPTKPEPETPAPQPTQPPVAPAVETQPQPAVEAQAGFVGDPMERIKEIKRLINEKVGNPITLIDADNQVGREYMNALLAAMKVANGGRPEEVTSTMQRLEKAFSEAIRVAETAPPPETQTDKFVKATTAPATPEPQPSAAPAQATAESVSAQPPAKPMDGNPVKINIKNDTDTPQSGFTPAAVTENPQVVAESNAPVVSATVGAEPQSPSFTPVPPRVGGSSLSSATMGTNEPAVKDPNAPETVPSAPEAAPTAESSTRLMSVAKEEQLENLMRQKKIEEVESKKSEEEKSRSTSDPYMLPEVTAGLKQLLSEWSLYKSSGFFGTGPGGMDHPLYKQMSGLTMAAVIAGRFEGASPQVKQSITDYMNGWRYEEGIMHEHSETFEHYLRRVIKHILDKKGVPKI